MSLSHNQFVSKLTELEAEYKKDSLMKFQVVYTSQTGNTKAVAEALAAYLITKALAI